MVKVRGYQKRWMADLTFKTKQSQWKSYLGFCNDYGLCPLPAEMDAILLYIAHLADRLKYVSIINYLSAVWSLHKLHGLRHVDRGSFEITMTLKGVRRVLGDGQAKVRPAIISELT